MLKNSPIAYRLYSPSEVAEAANVSLRTVYRWIKSGYLPAHKISMGENWSIKELDLRALLDGKLRGEKVPKKSPPKPEPVVRAAVRLAPDVTEQPVQSAGSSQLKPMTQKKRRR